MKPKFEETIVYRSHQHWIVSVLHIVKLSGLIGIPIAIGVLLFLDWMSAMIALVVVILGIVAYEEYLHSKSWLSIGTTKITLFVRNGLFSQYSISIRYSNIQDCACSKNSVLGYALGYGTFFARSVGGKEGEHFQANYVPKVGKVYAIINALASLPDDERAQVRDLDNLFSIYKKDQSDQKIESIDPVAEGQKRLLESIPGVVEVVVLSAEDCAYISKHEAAENMGIAAVVTRPTVFALIHDSAFREPDAPITALREDGVTIFPPVPFHELSPDAVSGSPGMRVHAYLIPKFREITIEYATVLVGV